MTIAARADVVGSLLRPPDLLKARKDFEAGFISEAEFRAAEDHAVDDAITLQEEAGLTVVTDGEMRRLSFQSQMTEAVDGFGAYDLDAFLWGNWRGKNEEWRIARPPSLGATGKLRRRRYLSKAEYEYLCPRTRQTPKITLPSPSLWVNFWSSELSGAAYPTLDSFLTDVVDILRDEVAELVRIGAAYIQLDAPHYTALLDPGGSAFYESQGWTRDKWLSLGIEMDNAVMSGFGGVTFGFHL